MSLFSLTQLENSLVSITSAGELIRSRLAPTPSGYLHLGNALNFLLTWATVRMRGGELLLRIDDLDPHRTRPEFIEDIFITLEWLGIDWDLGPESIDAFERHFSMRAKTEEYYHHLSGLIDSQEGFYVCDCSRQAVTARYLDGKYRGYCQARSLPMRRGEHVWRYRLNDAVHGDPVLWRKEDVPAYHLASLIEDETWRINWILRGEDLHDSTNLQQKLALRWGWEKCPQAICLHHPLLVDQAGNKLAKSDHACSLRSLREAGESPAGVYREVMHFLGLFGSPQTSAELLAIMKESCRADAVV